MSLEEKNLENLVLKVQERENELMQLKAELKRLQDDLSSQHQHQHVENSNPEANEVESWPLNAEEYKRYGRQMILSEIRLQGQLQLRKARVLIVGVGGLGCPAASYIAGAGVGKLGLVDGDTVEISNLHRQILHSTDNVGLPKVESAAESLRKLNPNVEYKLYTEHLTSRTALEIFKEYDLVLDCTDHPTSRYLISDASVLAKIPLVSGAALKTDGQLLVLNNPPKQPNQTTGGPCYRCVFPIPPSPDSVLSCGEGGILGPVVGVMGVLMAVEAIKVLTSSMPSSGNEPSTGKAEPPFSMLIYSAYSPIPFRTLRMKGKRADCVACSDQPSVTEDSLLSGSLDYAVFCGLRSPIDVLSPEERVTAGDFSKSRRVKDRNVLLDVRDATQFDICHLEGSVNIPYRLFESGPEEELRKELGTIPKEGNIYTICRFGNDSQLAVRKMKELGLDNSGERWIGDVSGGFQAWKKEVDSQWPEY